jgi:hypothetical protein
VLEHIEDDHTVLLVSPPSCSQAAACISQCQPTRGCGLEKTNSAMKRDLKPPTGPAMDILMAPLGMERKWLERGGRLPFGGSLLLVARRR